MAEILLKPIMVVVLMLMSLMSTQSEAIQEGGNDAGMVLSGDILIDDEHAHKWHAYPLAEISEEIREVLMELDELSKEKDVDRAFIGILLDDQKDSMDGGDGVKVIGVTPGGPAQEAGLEAGDVIISLDERSLAADGRRSSASKLFEELRKFHPGDEITVGYLRDGEKKSLQLTAASRSEHHVHIKGLKKGGHHGKHEIEKEIVVAHGHDSLGSVELFKLNEELGEYFSTDHGMLVLWVPENSKLGLKSGDVVLSIDGRTPKSISQTWRIIESYDAGDAMLLSIMRKHQKLELKVIKP